MIYPGYQLNPGDMFQVEPERVLYATGAPKDMQESREARHKLRRAKSAAKAKREKSAASSADNPSASERASKSPSQTPKPPAADPSIKKLKNPQEVLSDLLSSAKTILAAPLPDAKRKKELRSFQQNLQRALSRPTALSDSIEAQFLELSANLGVSPSPVSSSSAPKDDDTFNPKTAAADALAKPDATMLREALAEARDNPYDIRKPYATPWRPRDYMSPFAFIPRYLEVHHRICSAVYLRHPVARPGMAEVPTPFQNEMNGLAYLWYLRRR